MIPIQWNNKNIQVCGSSADCVSNVSGSGGGVINNNNPQMGHLRILKQRIKISEQENKYDSVLEVN